MANFERRRPGVSLARPADILAFLSNAARAVKVQAASLRPKQAPLHESSVLIVNEAAGYSGGNDMSLSGCAAGDRNADDASGHVNQWGTAQVRC